MTGPPITAIGAVQAADALALNPHVLVGAQSRPTTSFSGMLASGIDQVNQKLVDADALAKSFAVDDTVPLHQVTFALEQARLSFELMLQVRTKLVDAYQEFSRMQL